MVEKVAEEQLPGHEARCPDDHAQLERPEDPLNTCPVDDVIQSMHGEGGGVSLSNRFQSGEERVYTRRHLAKILGHTA